MSHLAGRIAVLCLLTFLLPYARAADGYQEATWGMTVDQVKQAVPGLGEKPCVSFSTDLAYCSSVIVLGKTGEASYQFDDGGNLVRVRLIFDPATAEFTKEVMRTMLVKYGACETENHFQRVTFFWLTEGVRVDFDVAGGQPTLVVTYDGAASASFHAAESAL